MCPRTVEAHFEALWIQLGQRPLFSAPTGYFPIFSKNFPPFVLISSRFANIRFWSFYPKNYKRKDLGYDRKIFNRSSSKEPLKTRSGLYLYGQKLLTKIFFRSDIIYSQKLFLRSLSLHHLLVGKLYP